MLGRGKTFFLDSNDVWQNVFTLIYFHFQQTSLKLLPIYRYADIAPPHEKFNNFSIFV